MLTLNDLLGEKGRVIRSTPHTATVLEATRKMNEYSVGALVVTNDDGQVVGIFTERDVLRRVVAEQRPPAETPVADVMTSEVVCCAPETTIDEARGVMKQKRIRHLPVVDDNGGIAGLISIGDLNAHQTNDHESQIFYLHEYLFGRV